jgi:hypothetical protein
MKTEVTSCVDGAPAPASSELCDACAFVIEGFVYYREAEQHTGERVNRRMFRWMGFEQQRRPDGTMRCALHYHGPATRVAHEETFDA